MAGTVKKELGLLFQGPNYVIVKKGGKAGEKVEKHNHPEANVIFTVVKFKYSLTKQRNMYSYQVKFSNLMAITTFKQRLLKIANSS